VERLEWATLTYVGSISNRRIYESLDYATPAEFEVLHYRSDESERLAT
jgi:hypothetical protein